MTRVVVIQTAFPGDVILASPIFQALKSRMPNSFCAAVVRPESVCLLRNNPYIDDIIAFDKYGIDSGLRGMMRIATRIRGYDRAVIVQRHLRSALIPLLAGIPTRIGYDNWTTKIFLTSKVRYNPEKHEVRRCLDLIGESDLRAEFRPQIFLDDSVCRWTDGVLSDKGIKCDYAVVAPGSVWPTKRYAHFARLNDLIYDKLNMSVVLVGGTADKEIAASLTKSVAHLPIDLCGQTDLLQSAALISKAKIVFSNDSAPAHIAAAVGTPVVAIFGPTVPAFGFTPYSENSAVVDIGKLECRPCSRHGSKKCPRGHFKCMVDLSPEKILETGRLLLSGITQNRLG
jgi:heptosyltransferase-2